MKKRLLSLLLLLVTTAGLAFAQDDASLKLDFGKPDPPKGVQLLQQSVWHQDGALAFYDQASSLTVTFQLPEGTDCSDWVMTVTDRMVQVNVDNTWTLFPAFVLNGRNVPTQAIPWTGFNTTTYPVGQFLQPGKNVLHVTSNADSSTDYQVQKITLGPPAR